MKPGTTEFHEKMLETARKALEDAPFICETHRTIGKLLEEILVVLMEAHKKHKEQITPELNQAFLKVAETGMIVPAMIQIANDQAMDMENGLRRRKFLMEQRHIEKEYHDRKEEIQGIFDKARKEECEINSLSQNK